MTITLSRLKTAGGEETPRFEATLVFNGNPVAVVSNDGNGGPCRYHWSTRPDGGDIGRACRKEAQSVAHKEEPRLFKADEGDDEGALDYVIFGEIELVALAKRLDRTCKGKIVLRETGQAPGSYMTVSVAYSTEAAERLRKDPKVAVILNELPSRERALRVRTAEV